MIKMTIHNGEEVQQRNLPCDFLSLRMSLYQMNLMRAPSEVSVWDVQAEFTSTDPIGQKLISLIRPTDLLSDVDVAVHQIKAAPTSIRETLCQHLLNGDLDTIEDIKIDRDRLLEEMCGARQAYYFPLTCSVTDEDGELYESDASELTQYSEQIQDAIEKDQARDIDTMVMYFWCHNPKLNDSIQSKLLTAVWGVEEIRGHLYGRVEVTSTVPLTAEETAAMKAWISGQNSDGLGEGFEQRPIQFIGVNAFVLFSDSFFLLVAAFNLSFCFGHDFLLFLKLQRHSIMIKNATFGINKPQDSGISSSLFWRK